MNAQDKKGGNNIENEIMGAGGHVLIETTGNIASGCNRVQFLSDTVTFTADNNLKTQNINPEADTAVSKTFTNLAGVTLTMRVKNVVQTAGDAIWYLD